MQNHIGEFLKQVIVNQGFAIKDFASLYKTTPSHMSDILAKKDISTSIIRKAEPILAVKFKLISSIDADNELDIHDESSQFAKIKASVGGRPPEFKRSKMLSESNSLTAQDVNHYLKEIEGLKALLSSKDEIIKSKDQIIKLKDELIRGLNSNKI